VLEQTDNPFIPFRSTNTSNSRKNAYKLRWETIAMPNSSGKVETTKCITR